MPQIKLDNQPVTQITIVEPEAGGLKAFDRLLSRCLVIGSALHPLYEIAVNRVFGR